MNVETKVINQNLSVLELAVALGNDSAVCRQRGVPQTQFYEDIRRFQTHDLAGLRDLQPIAKPQQNTSPPETTEMIKGLVMTHPTRGSNYLESLLKADGIQVSFVTIHMILERKGLGSRYDWCLAVEKRQEKQPIELTTEQLAFIEKQNAQFKEHHIESRTLGELLNQDTFLVCSFKGVGRGYMHVFVDIRCRYAFGFMNVSKQAEAVVAKLFKNVLPFCQNIVTDNGIMSCGTGQHLYDLNMELNTIKHLLTKVMQPQVNRFVERFNRTMREKVYSNLESLQTVFDQRLEFSSKLRPYLGDRYYGKKSME